MIDKQEFYHGAAIIKLIADRDFKSIIKEDVGYLINGRVFVYFKYSTKSRSPWLFTFGADEMGHLKTKAHRYPVTVAFVCGGDGICAIGYNELSELAGVTSCSLCVRRNYRERYSLSGPLGKSERKIDFKMLNDLVFERANDLG